MKVDDVTDTLDLALAASGCDKVKVEHRPRLLSDNGPCYVASDLGEWLETYKIDQVHGAPGHPQTQGKIERWHQTLKNRIEPPRVCRRPFGLSYAAMAGASSMA